MNSTVSAYRAAVVGTGVCVGRVYQEAVASLERYQEALSKVPVAYFVVCMTMQEDTEENRHEVQGYLDAVRE